MLQLDVYVLICDRNFFLVAVHIVQALGALTQNEQRRFDDFFASIDPSIHPPGPFPESTRLNGGASKLF